VISTLMIERSLRVSVPRQFAHCRQVHVAVELFLSQVSQGQSVALQKKKEGSNNCLVAKTHSL